MTRLPAPPIVFVQILASVDMQRRVIDFFSRVDGVRMISQDPEYFPIFNTKLPVEQSNRDGHHGGTPYSVGFVGAHSGVSMRGVDVIGLPVLAVLWDGDELDLTGELARFRKEYRRDGLFGAPPILVLDLVGDCPLRDPDVHYFHISSLGELVPKVHDVVHEVTTD